MAVNELGGAMTRHPAHLTEEQVKAWTRSTSLTVRGTGWSAPRARSTRTEVETLLRQRVRGLTSGSFQLPCKKDVLGPRTRTGPAARPRRQSAWMGGRVCLALPL